MVMYDDYVKDFPGRCSRLLRKLRLPAHGMSLEVTHLLSIATVGLIVPYERLGKGKGTPHPSGDPDRYKQAVSEYEELLEEDVRSSPLWPDGASSWRKGTIRAFRGQAPDFVQAFDNAKRMPPEVKAGTVVRILRNALAHGNIATIPRGREINDIMFLSGKNPKFRFVSVEPEDLREFMMNYFEFLSRLDLGRGRLVDDAPEAD